MVLLDSSILKVARTIDRVSVSQEVKVRGELDRNFSDLNETIVNNTIKTFQLENKCKSTAKDDQTRDALAP